MMRTGSAVGVSLVIGVLLAGSRMLWAEGFADISLGGAITQDANVNELSGGNRVVARGHFATSVSVGGRIGYWFEGAPLLGVAGSVSYYQPDIGSLDLPDVSRLDVTVVPLSPFGDGACARVGKQ
ncbi:MAG: hypothetical protein ABSA52_23615 [Candidatus Binatia bacterium]|jgi:hypothetical protein